MSHALPDDKWQKMLIHVNNVARERDIETGDFPAMLLLVKEFYHLPNDGNAIDDANEAAELAELTKQDTESDIASTVRKDRIAQLKLRKKK